MIAVVMSQITNDLSQFMPAPDNIEENCKRSLWRNFLLIHNFFSFDEICVSWTWYATSVHISEPIFQLS